MKMTRWGDREYYGKVAKPLSGNAPRRNAFKNGDVAFLVPGGSFAVFFDDTGNTGVSDLIVMGTVTSDPRAFAYGWTGATWHEVAGASLLILFIVHTVWSRRWYAAIVKGHYGVRRVVSTAVNLLLLAAALTLFVTGLLDSKLLAAFPKTNLDLPTRSIHTFTANWFLVLGAVHLGLHWKMIMTILGRAAAMPPSNLQRTVILRVLNVAVVAYGIYAWTERNIGYKLTGYYSFDFWDFEKSVLGFFAQYAVIICLPAAFAHYVSKLAQIRSRR